MTKGERTRKDLIEAALELFDRHGFHWVSFQQIGAQVGISQAALYKYFEDKDDLLAACCIHAAERGRQFIDALVPPLGSAKERLKAYVGANFQWGSKFRAESSTLLAMYYFSYTNKKVNEVFLRINEASLNRLEVILVQGKHEKAWKCRDPQASARFVHNVMVGELTKLINQPGEMKWERRLDTAWGFIFRALS